MPLAEPLEPSHPDVARRKCAEPQWWRLLPINLLKSASTALVLPLRVNVITAFFHGSTKKASAANGIASSFKAVFTILVSAHLGMFSDSIGRRPLIALSVLCALVPLAFLAFFPDHLFWYFAALALVGLLGGDTSPASQAYVADCIPVAKDRASVFGMLGASKLAMGAVMPIVTSFLERIYGRWLPFTCSVACMFAALIAACILPESLPRERRQPVRTRGACSKLVQTFRELFLRRGSLLFDFAVLEFLRKVDGGVPTQFAYVAMLHFTDDDFSVLAVLECLCSTLAMSVVLKLILRAGCKPITSYLLGVFVDFSFFVMLLVLFMFPIKPLVFLLTAYDALSTVKEPALESLMAHGTHDDVGFAYGSFQSIGEVASVLSPLLMTFLYQIHPAVPFIVAASLHFVSFLYGLKVRARMAQMDLDASDGTSST